MARIAGINIPLNKHIVIALTSIYGIGNTRAKQVCAAAGVDPTTPVKDLAEPEVAKLRAMVDQFEVEGDLTVDPDNVPGLPKVIARRFQSRLESFIVKALRPNLTSIATAVQRYLDARPV